MTASDIVVVGSCNIDLTCYTKRTPRIGETIYGKKFTIGYGGKGANQCIAAAKLGASTAIVGRLGNDNFGKEYLDIMKKFGVNTEHLNLTEGISTGIAQIVFSEEDANNFIIIIDGANGLLSAKDAENALHLIAKAKVGLFQFEISTDTILTALRLFKKHNSNATVIVNASPVSKDMDREIFKLCDIFIVNEIEADILTNIKIDDPSDANLAAEKLISFGCKTAIVTCGSRGVVYKNIFETGPVHVPVEAVNNPVDTTGAGDLFLGALAYSFVHKEELSLGSKIKLACDIARLSVMKIGAQTSFPSYEEVKHLLD